VSGSIDDNTATVTIDGINATVSAGTFSADIQLTEGANTVTATATDPVGNQAATSVNITLDTVAPDAVDPNQVAISEVSTGFVNVSGAAGSAEPSATVTVTNSRTAVTAATAAAADGSFSVDISALDGDLLYIVVTDAAGNSSGATSVTVSIGGAGTLIQYEYDANGNRVRKIKTGN
jgi:YD repeat-containing protein